MLQGVSRTFSDDIAIDLGTANTLVHVVGRGIIIDEPSVVAVQVRGGMREVLAVGLRAKAMLGRTPEPIELVRPMRDGVIADFIATEEMLRQFISRAKTMLGFRRPRILICVPAGATPVERRAVYETAVSAGARKVYLIEEPVAASLGAGLPIDGPSAFMVVDIGGGTTDIAVLSRGNVIQARSLKVAGNAMDEAVMRYVRRKHGLVIGETNAERIKIEAGTALPAPNGRQIEIHIKGRDLAPGPDEKRGARAAAHGRGALRAGRRDGRVHPARARGPAAGDLRGGDQARHRADRRRRTARPARRCAGPDHRRALRGARTAPCTA